MIREPLRPAHVETVVRKSRFIATASPASSVDEAEAAISTSRTNHPDASHVVYAFLVGGPQSERAGMSDAGEPKGTAGGPVMDILRGSDVWNIVITVVRYFGGTKLGTGGLVRAYADAARQVLNVLPTRQRIARRRLHVRVAYELHEPIRRAIEEAEGTISEEQFGTDVTMTWEMPESAYAGLRERLQDLTRGTVSLNELDRDTS
jgi:uncharacterized YigZ family protein